MSAYRGLARAMSLACICLSCDINKEDTDPPEVEYQIVRVLSLDSLGTDARDLVAMDSAYWVLTDHPPFVTVFDRLGVIREQFGPRGRGPRDLLAPWSITRGAGDSIPWIYDAGKRAMLQLPRRSLESRSVPLRTVLGSVRSDFREVTYGEIAGVFRSSTGFIAPIYRGDGTVTRSLLFPALVSFSAGGEPLDTLVDFLRTPPDTTGLGPALDLIPIPLFAGCGTDTVFVFDGYSDQIERVTLDGKRNVVAKLSPAVPPARVPSLADRVQYVRGQLEVEYAGADRPKDLEARAERLARVDAARFTAVFPRLTRLRCGPRGMLLVQGFSLDDNRVGYGRDWYVLQRDGERLRRVAMPTGFEPRTAVGDTLLGFLVDESERLSIAFAVTHSRATVVPRNHPGGSP